MEGRIIWLSLVEIRSKFMLYVTFKEPRDYLYNVSANFNSGFRPEWLEDDFIKRAILDIDNTTVLSPYCLQSPVLGQIAPSFLSNGVKNIILTKFTDFIKRGGCYGDNCSYWLGEISKQKDVLIYLTHYLHFPDNYEFDASVIDTGAVSHNSKEWQSIIFDHIEGCYEYADEFDLTINPIEITNSLWREELGDKI